MPPDLQTPPAPPRVEWSVTPANWNLIRVGPGFETVVGRDLTEFNRDPDLWSRMIHSEDWSRVHWVRTQAVETGTYQTTYRIILPDQTIRWMHEEGSIVLDGDGQVIRFDGSTTDVTRTAPQYARFSEEHHIRDLFATINAGLIRQRSAADLCALVCRVAVEVGRMEGVQFLIADGASMRPGVGVGPAWHAAHQDAEDPSADLARTSGQVQARGGVAIVPLLGEADCHGVLVLQAQRDRVFDGHDQAVLAALGTNLGVALDMIAREERLEQIAYVDPLTGLPNHQAFLDRLAEQMDAAGPNGRIGVIVLDVERFHVINDALGRKSGNDLLHQLAERLRTVMRRSDFVSRLSGDQFAVMLPNIPDRATVEDLISRNDIRFFDDVFPIAGQEFRIAWRAGLAVFPEDGQEAVTVFHNAEAALKSAKQGHERYRFYEPRIHVRVAEQLELETRLRRAVDLFQFVLHYQPKIDLRSGAVVGLEALLRWQDGERGLVAPGFFIPMLEQMGLIEHVGRWAIRQAMQVRRAWTQAGLVAPPIAVNVSAVQLRQPRFVQDVADAMGMNPDADGLDLEITESMVMENVAGVIAKLQEIRKLGIRVSMDDFGTGYSSLSYMHMLPIDVLKIDRSFLIDMHLSPSKSSIVRTIIQLAHSLGMRVVAEGVELAEQASYLRQLGCDEAQGYFFSRPVPQEEIERRFLLRAVPEPV
ncbi:putative bifunctional diguanylate cyclase/phosphodiesterase [Zavarzinia sp. CC-PAN008]|uniref:putative bifunctional diguanylate cyclase/phosphodiesterase n=1 Tax=Zavarzinia sp. CC-PAN008 TaxID=3243332 RepID=UPI003F74357A